MNATPETQVKTIDDLGMDAMTAFAKLRTYTPGRGAYLIEALSPKGEAGEYSIVAYRAIKSESMPPGVDPVTLQVDETAAQARPESFAEALALASVGYINYGVATLRQGIRLCDDESAAGQFLVGATVMVFDHSNGKVSIAAKKKGNLVERCIWEAQHGPDIAPLASVQADAVPKDLDTTMRDEKFAAKAVRAHAFLGDELSRLMLAQTYWSPIADSDPFDVYRAWRQLTATKEGGEGFGYYIDMGTSPMTPPLQIMGFSEECLFSRHRDHGDEGEPKSVVAQALPHPRTTGDPPEAASKLIRRVEDTSRHIYGGAVGYFCPGGESLLMLADQTITAQTNNYWHTVGATLSEDGNAMDAPALAREGATAGIAAIAAAHAQSA